MGALGLVSVLIGHVGDGELLAGLLIHPGEGSVDNSGLVLGANVLKDSLLVDAGAIAGLQDGAPSGSGHRWGGPRPGRRGRRRR